MADSTPDALAIALVDSHCHLDLDDFDADRLAVVASAGKAGVTRIHVPGTTAARWSGLLNLAEQAVFDVSLGLHPYFLGDHHASQLDRQIAQLRQLFQAHRDAIFAVGECGLDAVVPVDIALQQRVFADMISLANDFSKPLILHARKTHHLIHQLLNQQGFEGRGIIHAFSGSKDVAERYIERGFLLGIGGTITYPRANKTRQAIQHVGLEHLVLETDSPDMPLMGFQGQRNTPERLPLVAGCLAELLGTDTRTVANATTQNYLSLTV